MFAQQSLQPKAVTEAVTVVVFCKLCKIAVFKTAQNWIISSTSDFRVYEINHGHPATLLPACQPTLWQLGRRLSHLVLWRRWWQTRWEVGMCHWGHRQAEQETSSHSAACRSDAGLQRTLHNTTLTLMDLLKVVFQIHNFVNIRILSDMSTSWPWTMPCHFMIQLPLPSCYYLHVHMNTFDINTHSFVVKTASLSSPFVFWTRKKLSICFDCRFQQKIFSGVQKICTS